MKKLLIAVLVVEFAAAALALRMWVLNGWLFGSNIVSANISICIAAVQLPLWLVPLASFARLPKEGHSRGLFVCVSLLALVNLLQWSLLWMAHQ